MSSEKKGLFTKIVIALFCLAFVFWGVLFYITDSGRSGGSVIAKVNGEKITAQALAARVHQLQQRIMANGTQLTSAMNQQIKALAKEQLVAEAALVQTAEKEGFNVSKEQVRQLVFNTPIFQANGQFSPQKLQQYLYNIGQTQQQFFYQLRRDLLINQVSSGIQGGSFVLPNELEANYDLINQQRSFSYLTISAKTFAGQVKVTPSDMKNYYTNNKASFSIPEKISISYIELSPKAISQTLKVSDAEVKNYYQSNIGNYRKAQTWTLSQIQVSVVPGGKVSTARFKMQQILTDLKKKPFATIFNQNKGKVVTLNEAQMPPVMLNVVKGLKVGQTSAVFNTKAGFSIVRLTKVTPATTQAFADVKANIQKMLIHQKAQKIVSKQTDELTTLTYTNPDSLEPAARSLNMQVQTSPLFSRLGAKQGVAADPNVIKAAYSKSIMQQGNNSNPITLKDGTVIVLRVKQHVKASTKPFAQVEAQIKAQLQAQMEQAKAAILANQIQASIEQGQTAAAVASKHKLTWVPASAVGRTDKKLPANIVAAAFKLSLGKKDNLSVVGLDNGDTALVQLTAITKPDFSQLSDKQKLALQAKLQKFFGNLSYQLYMVGVRQGIKAK